MKAPLESSDYSGILSPFVRFGDMWNRSQKQTGGFLIAIMVGWLVQLVYCMSVSPTPAIGAANFCVLWFSSGAAFFCGTLAGIIFGLPRTRIASASPAFSQGNYRPNTNLEDVSDWLSKIIVGIGIAQFPSIVSAFSNIANIVGKSIDTGPSGVVIAISGVIYGMIYGMICGFFTYYV